jgi:chloramphenicol-sensitive protein RarD
VLIFHEPFGMTQAIAFALIWAALAIYSWPMLTALAGASRGSASGTTPGTTPDTTH